MALFGSKKKTAKKAETKVKKSAPEVSTTETPSASLDLSHIIVRPRITEKASFQSEKNIYSFEVSERATKHTVAAAVKELYNVDAVKVNIVSIPPKEVFIRGKWGVKKGGKKAYVFLKKGETIEFV